MSKITSSKHAIMKGKGSAFGRNVFVLDVSSSMRGMREQTLQLSVNRMIADIPDNSYVGIVFFSESAELGHKMVQISDKSVREQLIKTVQPMKRRGTDIGSGILYGLQMFGNADVCTEGATMFLITDGEDCTGRDYVSQVLPTLLEAKIRVICTAIGNTADHRLERLSRETIGSTYFTDGSKKGSSTRVIQSALQESESSRDMAEAVIISVCDDIIHLKQTNVTKNVIIDSDIGRNTVFSIESEDFDQISVCIKAPNGQKYDSTSSGLVKDNTLKRYQLKTKTAKCGIWSICLTTDTNRKIWANISVKSQPLNPNAVKMKVTLKEADSNFPPIIIAELSKGNDFVVGAEVTATVDKPDGTQSQLKLISYNNVYCNYFTDYCGSGRYNVSVFAQNKESDCYLMCLRLKTAVSEFERQQIAGCFKVTDSMPQRPANDLKLEELSLRNSFNAMSLYSEVLAVRSSAPRKAKAVVRTRDKAVPQIDDKTKVKEKINNLLLLAKKSMNSPEISDIERNYLKNVMDGDFNTKSAEELKDCLKQLKDMVKKRFT